MTATALLVVDMLNSYRHPDADRLAPNVAEIVDPLADLITRARQRDDVELVYVNDNYGDFVADRNALTRAALEGARPDLVKPIMPTSDAGSCHRICRRSSPTPRTACPEDKLI